MTNTSNLKFYFYAVVAFTAGALLALAFAPIHYYLFAILCPAVLLYCWQQFPKPRQAFFLGWIFGIGQFTVGVSWIYISIHEYGETPWWFAASLTILFIAFLSLYPALQGYLLNRYFPRNNLTKSLIAFPSTWIICEYLRSTVLGGFPWLLLGYSQTSSFLGSVAPLFGSYGIALLLTLLSGLLLNIVRDQKRLICATAGMLILVACYFLQFISWTNSTQKDLTVSLIQGNITQSLKWSPQNFQNTLETYQKLTKKHWSSDLIVWPEAAITMPLDSMNDFFSAFGELANAHHAAIIVGIPVASPQKNFYYNGLIAIGKGQGQYFKQKLVAYAESLPFQSLFQGLLDKFNLPLPNVVAGSSNQIPLTIQDTVIAPFICYDLVDSDVVRQRLPKAQLLLTISDDAWFGHSFAQAQHLEIASMRSRETSRYQVTTTNDGLTAIIDENGVIKQQLPPFKEDVLTGKVELRDTTTPWIIWGDYPVLFLALFCFVSSLVTERSIIKSSEGEILSNS